MGLQEYKNKRDFNKTAEPKAGTSKNSRELIFVVQKHAASRLHYDFRLEMDGVLKSWAVPKGPSTDPAVKHLAMRVEDHPFDYRDFEGVIPAGEYGGGTVIVWDRGTYEPLTQFKSKKSKEKHLLEQLEAGSLKFRLQGKKLNGEYALVKTHGMKGDSWLLIKHRDEFASKKDITKMGESVLSGKTLEQVSKSAEKVWKDGKEQSLSGMDQLREESGVAPESVREETKGLLNKIKKSKLPINLKPMKATLVDKAFDDNSWCFEVKWDGYRALAYVDETGCNLVSRNNLSFDKFYPIREKLESLGLQAVLDGEIVVLNEEGVADFGALQNWRSEADGDLFFYVFDLLWYEGKLLTSLPLSQRRAILKNLLDPNDEQLRLSEAFEGRGIELFEAASKIGLEGIIAKRLDSTYTSDLRSKDWLKIKVQKRQEVVIAGYTKNAGTSKLFSALLLGVYEGGKLKYAGKVGTGFSDSSQKALMRKFEDLVTERSAFEEEPDVDKPSRFRPQRLGARPVWLKPELIAEINFAEVTSDGLFRQASYKGLRQDKEPAEVHIEKEERLVKIKEKDEAHPRLPAIVKAPKRKEKKTLLNPKDETQVRVICKRDLKFTNLGKLYWPEDNFSKRDMLNYYYRVAEYILPYLLDRPLSLNRFPNGIKGKAFYQKDVRGKTPEWVDKTYPYTSSDGEVKEYLVGSDEAYLLWVASLGCIEMNPWFSRIQRTDMPDYCVLDLDPDKQSFDQVTEVALYARELLENIGVRSYVKTSGSTGLHIFIPLGAKYTYEQSQMFARLIVTHIQAQFPDMTTLERTVAKRGGRMYLDFLQNRPGATIACAYSLRPKPGVPVSTPLEWSELKPGIRITDYNAMNIFDRLKDKGDIFIGVMGEGADLLDATEKLKSQS